MCGTNARLAVLDGLVADGELSKVVANHVRLDLNLHWMNGAVVRVCRWAPWQYKLAAIKKTCSAALPKLGCHMHLIVSKDKRMLEEHDTAAGRHCQLMTCSRRQSRAPLPVSCKTAGGHCHISAPALQVRVRLLDMPPSVPTCVAQLPN